MTPSTPSALAVGLVGWAQAEPDRIAVADADRHLTFAEFDALVGTLARRIREATERSRVGSTFLPVLVGSDAASAVAVHAAVRAGVPWTPLDRELPDAALHHLFARIGRPAVAVVTDPAGRTLPGDPVGLTVPGAPDDPIPPAPVNVHEPALVVFTSGSTGRPKGVVYTGAMVDERWLARIVPAGKSVACPMPMHWLGGLDLVLNVFAGDSVSIVDARTLDAVGLFDWLDAGGFTRCNFVPTQLARLLDRLPPGRRLERVDSALVVGEPLAWATLAGLRERLAPDAEIHVAYGATETVNAPIRIVVGPDDPIGVGWVPMGGERTPGRVRLEPHGDPADGVGEIVVLGHVAAGYLDDPALTSARFGVDPDGRRWWRSGDLATLDADGRFHHRGRVDDQVKVGGRLVEPAEPERVLGGVPGVRRAVVVPHESPRGRVRLVAHLELGDPPPTAATVRSALESELSGALVPSPLVRHDGLPQRPNGKVDRFALRSAPIVPWSDPPPPDVPEPDALVRAVTARAATFVDWGTCEPDDDLWLLGLDSLDAVELALACSALGAGALAPTALLDARTPRALAERLRTGTGSRGDDLVTLNAGGTRPPFVVLPGAGGTAHALRPLADALGTDQPVVVVEARGLHTPGSVDRTVEASAVHVLEQMTGRWPADPIVLAGWSAGGVVALEVAQRLTDAGQRVHLVWFDSPLRGRRVRLGFRARLGRPRCDSRSRGSSPRARTPRTPGATSGRSPCT